jgi:hypothetical protein
MERLAAVLRQLRPRDAAFAGATRCFAGAKNAGVDPERFVEDGKKIGEWDLLLRL